VNRGSALLALAVAGIVGLGTLLFFALFEKRVVEVETLQDPLVRQNPFRAAEILLERMGLEVVSRDGLHGLGWELADQATVLLPTTRETLSPSGSRELVEWVERGGHLIVVTWSLWDDPDRRPDPILDPLGLHQVFNANVESELWPEAEPEGLKAVAQPVVQSNRRGPPIASAVLPGRAQPRGRSLAAPRAPPLPAAPSPPA